MKYSTILNGIKKLQKLSKLVDLWNKDFPSASEWRDFGDINLPKPSL
jgi:hypothetical protein